MQYAFFLLAPFAFLGSADFRGNWLVGLLRAFIRVLFVFAASLGLTYFLVARDAFAPPAPKEIARQTCLVVKADRATCLPPDSSESDALANIWEDALEPVPLHDTSVLERLREIDDTINPRPASFVVQTREDDGWVDVPDTAEAPEADAPQASAAKPNATLPEYRIIARYDTDADTAEVTILTVEPAFKDVPTPSFLTDQPWLRGLWEGIIGPGGPFRAISFEASPYVLSSMVLGRADPDLSARDRDRAKEIMDAHLDTAPTAATPGFVWPRRLNGPVQYACYMLFFAGLIYIALHWIVNILPNRLLAGMTSFQVDRRRLGPDGADMVHDAPPPREADEGEDAKAETPPPPPARETVTVRAPWRSVGEHADLDLTIRKMEAIRDDVTRRSGHLTGGAVPAFPKLDVWIAGLLAMKSSRSGENVPSFVSVEIEAAAERLEAHQRLLAFIVWAIPTLGFIGTVIGIGTALLATVDLQSGEIITRLQAESRVAVEIGVAFDTTLVALALSFVLMLALHLLQQLEESMLAAEKHDALRALVQIENILPDDPIKELRNGLAQMGLSAAQIERWTEVLDGQAPKFRDTLNRAEADIREWEASRQPERRKGKGSPTSLILAALLGAGLVAAFAYWSDLVALFS